MVAWKTTTSIFMHLLSTLCTQCGLALNYYECRAVSSVSSSMLNFSCPPGQLMTIESALVGFSDQYNGQTNPPKCPWTNTTSATCSAIMYPDGSNCNCTKSTGVPATLCNGKNGCSFFQETVMMFPAGTALCVLQKDANFISINYTCNNESPTVNTTTTSTTSSTTTSTTTTSRSPGSSTATTRGSSVVSSTKVQHNMNTTVPAIRSTVSSSSAKLTSAPRNWATVKPADNSRSKTLRSGEIAGIVIGCVAFVALLLMLILLLICCKRKGETIKNSASNLNLELKRSSTKTDASDHDEDSHNLTSVLTQSSDKPVNGVHLANGTEPQPALMSVYEEAAKVGVHDTVRNRKLITGHQASDGHSGHEQLSDNSIDESKHLDLNVCGRPRLEDTGDGGVCYNILARPSETETHELSSNPNWKNPDPGNISTSLQDVSLFDNFLYADNRDVTF